MRKVWRCEAGYCTEALPLPEPAEVRAGHKRLHIRCGIRAHTVNGQQMTAFTMQTFTARHTMFRSFFTAFCLTLALGFACAVRAVPIYDFVPVAAEMNRFVQTHQLAGASLRVARAGNAVHRQAYGGYTLDTRIRIASASKWLSGLAIARLVEKGQMRWTDTVGQYFPQAPVDKTGITLEQLFSHTSGLPPTEDSCMSNPQYTLASCAERILQKPLIGTPGRVFAYGGNSMQVAGRMAEIAAGKRWDDVFIDEMVLPLGLVATDYATASTAPGYVRNTNPRVPGGVRSTLEDYGRVMDMVLARGCLVGGFTERCPTGQRFLTVATLDTMARDRTIGTTIIYRPPTTTDYGYGIGQWIENADGLNAQIARPILSSPGAFGVTPWVDHMRGTAGVLFVEDQLSAVNADINDIRAMVNVVTVDGNGRRVRPVLPAISAPLPAAKPSLPVRVPAARARNRSER
jgi:CubicO group peptidase (beta-lactamase class C family)